MPRQVDRRASARIRHEARSARWSTPGRAAPRQPHSESPNSSAVAMEVTRPRLVRTPASSWSNDDRHPKEDRATGPDELGCRPGLATSLSPVIDKQDRSAAPTTRCIRRTARGHLRSGQEPWSFRIETKPTPRATAQAPPSRKPRDSMPTTCVTPESRQGSARPSTTDRRPSASAKMCQTSAWPPSPRKWRITAERATRPRSPRDSSGTSKAAARDLQITCS